MESKEMSIGREELVFFARDYAGFHDLDIGNFSTIFLGQIFNFHFSRSVSTFSILDEINHLEGKGRASHTAKENQYKHDPLKGLWKKHFTDARFISKNIDNHFGLSKGGNKKLDQVINRVCSNHTETTEAFADELSYELTINAYQSRVDKNRMTGEWIVFQKYEGKNYYLTLASHQEEDNEIYKRVCMTYDMNFPFLNETKS